MQRIRWLDEICKHQVDFENRYLEQLVFMVKFLRVGFFLRMNGASNDNDYNNEEEEDSIQRNIASYHMKIDLYKKLATQFPSKFQPEFMYQLASHHYVNGIKFNDINFDEPKREEFGLSVEIKSTLEV